MSIGEKKSDHKIVKKNNTRSQNYEKAQKNISFGSLKINTELPVQRWWFKSTPKLRTVIFLMVVVFLSLV
jgi:hypothetical protein